MDTLSLFQRQIERHRRVAARQAFHGGPYEAGYDCGKNGPNTDNCHFRWFNSQHRAAQWELGKRAAQGKTAP